MALGSVARIVVPADVTRDPVVALVNDMSGIGGGPAMMLTVARALRRAGMSPHIIAPGGPETPEIQGEGIEWTAFEFHDRRILTRQGRLPRPRGLAARVPEALRLRSLLDQINAAILHTGALVPHVSGILASIGSKRPIVWHLNQVHPWVLFAGPLPDRVIAVSDATLAPGIWRRGVRARAAVVPNGIDVEVFRPPTPAERELARQALDVAPGQPVVVTVARVEPSKGIHVLIEAVTRSSSRPTLLVVGDSEGFDDDGQYSSMLKRSADQAGSDIRFLGPRKDVHRVLWAADAFAFASRSEAFGLVLAEASAVGLPVISSNVGGCQEVVVEGLTGLLVEPADAFGFGAALDRVLGAPELASDLGREGRRRAKTMYDVRKYDEQIVPLYQQLLERVS